MAVEGDGVQGYLVAGAAAGAGSGMMARGRVNVPAVFEGREILLCWKGEEETIGYWHEVESGYAGRKPVGMLAR